MPTTNTFRIHSRFTPFFFVYQSITGFVPARQWISFSYLLVFTPSYYNKTTGIAMAGNPLFFKWVA
jgi:hypothetical protein